ncbi:hypothetical protein [Bythopirellula goksoeyrii]|nr:hypothetical protein [Bythopirellula goksoeyrii]
MPPRYRQATAMRELVPGSYTAGGIDMEIGEDNLNLDFDLK